MLHYSSDLNGVTSNLPTKDAKKSREFHEETILQITDRLVEELNKARKLIIITITTIIIAVPLSWHIAPLIASTPYRFRVLGVIFIVVSMIFLILGVRQWAIISSFTRKYRDYKKRMKEVESQLDFDDNQD